MSTAPKMKSVKGAGKLSSLPTLGVTVERAAGHEKAPRKNKGFVTPADVDFSEWVVPGAVLPASELEFNHLALRFGKMFVGAFEQQEKDAGRGITLDAWDEYIFDSIQEYGSLVLLSRSVVRRIHAWQFDATCIPKLRRLGEAFVKATKIRRREARGRITSKHALFKEFMIPELSLLRKKLVAAWPKDARAIIEFVSDELRRPDCCCANLARNHDSLIEFLIKNQEVAVRFRGTFKRGATRTMGSSDDVGPVRFVHLWIAEAENKTEGSVKVQLSRLSKQ